jgi:hypothetical protein
MMSTKPHASEHASNTHIDDTQMFNVDINYSYGSSDNAEQRAMLDVVRDDHMSMDTHSQCSIQTWEDLLGQTSTRTRTFHDVSQSNSIDDVSTSFTFPHHHQQQQQQRSAFNMDNVYGSDTTFEQLDDNIDYETIIRSKNLYNDPEPQTIRKSMNNEPVIYTQNIMLRFLQPPPVPQGPLIIREVRPPQPPPPPPLVIV